MLSEPPSLYPSPGIAPYTQPNCWRTVHALYRKRVQDQCLLTFYGRSSSASSWEGAREFSRAGGIKKRSAVIAAVAWAAWAAVALQERAAALSAVGAGQAKDANAARFSERAAWRNCCLPRAASERFWWPELPALLLNKLAPDYCTQGWGAFISVHACRRHGLPTG